MIKPRGQEGKLKAHVCDASPTRCLALAHTLPEDGTAERTLAIQREGTHQGQMGDPNVNTGLGRDTERAGGILVAAKATQGQTAEQQASQAAREGGGMAVFLGNGWGEATQAEGTNIMRHISQAGKSVMQPRKGQGGRGHG